MVLREFEDRLGTLWKVWEAHPRLIERRTAAERRTRLRPAAPRRKREQRKTPAIGAASQGWLVFHSGTARRRQRPIPPGWHALTASELELLLVNARPSGPRSRVTE